ncbi:MAG: alpha/beta hydrolase [Promethearchaeota archaeon]
MKHLFQYWRYLRTVGALYEEGKYQETIDFLKEVATDFPDFKPEIYYTQMAAAIKLDKYDLFFELLNEILDADGWYSEAILRESPAFKPLQGMSEFERLVSISVERAKQASKDHTNLTVFPEHTNPSMPLMLALHAQASVINEEYQAWKTVIDHGYILGMPQTTNRYWSGIATGYWPDYETSIHQIKAYVDTINLNKTLDLKRSIAGGLSKGGDLAIRLALTGTIPVCAFIAVSPGGPWMNEPEKWQSLIDDARRHELHGIIIRGKQDQAIPRKYTQTLTNMLNNSGVPCQFLEYPQLGHWYPPNFDNIIADLITTIE